ncbi:flippase [Salinigranum halophilum]|uniref:flippase n=1 Tax=Salinigranum halophilum TaxID=2565931 RepID=UPI0010A8E121|nr:flippase [Salinigranum halophilum]
MSLQKKLSSDVLVTVLVRVGTRFEGLIFIPLIGKLLGLAAYGAYVQILAITGLLATVLDLGLHSALIRYGQEESQDVADLYYSLTTFAVACGSLAAILLMTFSTSLSELTLGNRQYGEALLIGSTLVPLKVFSGMARNYFRMEMNTKIYSMIEAVRSYASIGAVALVILYLNWELEGVMTVLVAIELVIGVGIQYFLGRRIGYTIPSFQELERCLRYSIPLTGSMIASELAAQADKIIVGSFLGASAVGIYSISYSIANFISIYSSSAYTSLFPEISRLLENGERERCGKIVQTSVRYYIVIAVPSAIGIYLVGPTVIRLISTPEAAGPANALVPIVGLGIILLGLERLYELIPVANEDTVVISKIKGVAAVTNILMNVALVPVYGITGAAVATVLSYGASSVLVYRESNIRVKTRFPLVSTVKTAAASAVMFVVLYSLLNRNLLPSLVVGPLVYFVVMIAIDGIELAELTEVI